MLRGRYSLWLVSLIIALVPSVLAQTSSDPIAQIRPSVLKDSYTHTQTVAAVTPSEAQTPRPPIPLQIVIPTPPTAFRGDTQWHLCYEIYLTNLSSSSWTVQRIDVKNESGAPLLTVQEKELDRVLSHPALPPSSKGGPAAEIAPGEAVIAYMWIDLTKGAPIPTHLQHQFGLKKSGDEKNDELGAPMTPVSSKPPEIISPLRGKNWVAVNGPSNTSLHRRTMIVLDATPHIAQRYAIDWLQIGDDGQTYHGDAKDNRSYYCYGVEARAVADGVVVEVKDGIPENTPNASPVVPITLETIAGNHVNLDLGGGVYAMYAHLQPGSIRVKLGDKVTPEQVIGLVGNTGNSSEPHLHFQLMNRNSPLASEGLPYSLPAFEVTGRPSSDKATFDHLAAPETHHGDLPLDGEVVDFEP